VLRRVLESLVVFARRLELRLFGGPFGRCSVIEGRLNGAAHLHRESLGPRRGASYGVRRGWPARSLSCRLRGNAISDTVERCALPLDSLEQVPIAPLEATIEV
jgi:hypothetical protein